MSGEIWKEQNFELVFLVDLIELMPKENDKENKNLLFNWIKQNYFKSIPSISITQHFNSLDDVIKNKKTLFILDSYDEIETSTFKNVFPKNFLNSSILTKFIFFSRPFHLKLPPNISLHLDILGFDINNIFKYIEKYFDKTETKTHENLIEMINENEILKLFASNPLFLELVCINFRKNKFIPQKIGEIFQILKILIKKNMKYINFENLEISTENFNPNSDIINYNNPQTKKKNKNGNKNKNKKPNKKPNNPTRIEYLQVLTIDITKMIAFDFFEKKNSHEITKNYVERKFDKIFNLNYSNDESYIEKKNIVFECLKRSGIFKVEATTQEEKLIFRHHSLQEFFCSQYLYDTYSKNNKENGKNEILMWIKKNKKEWKYSSLIPNFFSYFYTEHNENFSSFEIFFDSFFPRSNKDFKDFFKSEKSKNKISKFFNISSVICSTLEEFYVHSDSENNKVLLKIFKSMSNDLKIVVFSFIKNPDLIDFISSKYTDIKYDLFSTTKRTSFHYACKNNKNIKIIQKMRKLFDINAKDEDERTPLFLSVNNRIEILRYMIDEYEKTEKRIEIKNIKDKHGNTLLHSACCGSKDIKVVKLLIKKGVEYTTPNKSGLTPFHYACMNDNTEIINHFHSLRNEPLYLEALDENGRNHFHWACMTNKNTKIIENLIKEKNMAPEFEKKFLQEKDKNNLCCLRLACLKNDNIEVIKFLIQKFESLTIGYSNLDLIKYSLYNINSFNIIKYLIDFCHFQVTPSHMSVACELNKPDIIFYFFNEKNMELIYQNDFKNSPFLKLAKKKTEIKKKLFNDLLSTQSEKPKRNSLFEVLFGNKFQTFLEEKFEIEHFFDQNSEILSLQDSDNKTPLHYACQHRDLETIKYLIGSETPNLNKKDNFGKTPFDYACHSNTIDVIQYLFQFSVSLECLDKKEKTPLHYASLFNPNLDVIKFLVENKSDINRIDVKNSKKNENKEIFEFLEKKIN